MGLRGGMYITTQCSKGICSDTSAYAEAIYPRPTSLRYYTPEDLFGLTWVAIGCAVGRTHAWWRRHKNDRPSLGPSRSGTFPRIRPRDTCQQAAALQRGLG
eukprot:2853211-Pyramimonas_sp.AAC.1